MIGQTYLHYRIIEKIGEGGMGTVYRAIDTHLDRPVAIKVLPPDKVSDPERKGRFVQEAKAASALRHPNIVVIHDIASDRGVELIVMELVEGQSLDQLIGRRGLKLGEALGWAVQIAEGLTKAHAAGIVHRDLKPTNIMVTGDGLVKILDFGLAKLTESAPASELGPTMTVAAEERPRTEAGIVVGTAAYMSPEQAEGRKVDSRSDVFSFGAVLYEMLTGRKAFGRESGIKTLAAVLGEEPKPPSTFNESIPSELEHVLVRCLRKDPQRRWQTMSDLKVALQDLKEDSESGRLQAARAPAGQRRRKAVLPAAAALLLILASAVILKFVVLKPPGPITYEITPLTYDPGFAGFPTLPLDGSMMAFASDRGGGHNFDIWVQRLAGGKPLRLTDHPATDWFPSFAPDGSQIAFRSERDGGGIYIIDALGGEARRVADGGVAPRFSPDGLFIAFVAVPPSLETSLFRMYLVSPKGGEPLPFHHELIPESIGQGGSIVWSPDGKRVLLRGRRSDDPKAVDWWVAPVDGGEAVRTHAIENLGIKDIVHFPVGWSGNDVYYVSGTTIEGVNLFRAPIDPKGWTIGGPAEPITTGPGMKVSPAILPDGRVVFSDLTAAINIWSVPARSDGGVVSAAREGLTRDTMQQFSPTISRDGSKAAFVAFGGSRASRIEVRIKDLRSGQETVLPMRGIVLGGTVLSPDGSVLAYRDIVDGKARTYVLAAGAAAGREVCAGCTLLDFFPGNDSALVMLDPGALARMELRTGNISPFFSARGGTIRGAKLAPDGKWLAWLGGGPDGRVSLRISPVGGPPGDSRSEVTIAQADYYLGSPDWSPDGRWLYFLSAEGGETSIRAQELDPGTKKPRGADREVFAPPEARFLLNFPMGNGAIAVAADRIIFGATEVRGNIYLARPKAR